MSLTPADLALLGGAGVLAGAVGAAGGIASLVSYPALLAVGLPAFGANVVNVVALVTMLPGSTLASRPELEGSSRWLRRWVIVAALGGLAGAVLLLSTPPGIFARIVPFLVAAGALALLLQPRLSRLTRRPEGGNGLLLGSGMLPVAAYNSYFGAGSGVMTLALLLIALDIEVVRANALKNILVGVSSLVAAVALISFGHVRWEAVVPLSAGAFLGSNIGPRIARRVNPTVLRWLVGCLGLALALRLFLAPA